MTPRLFNIAERDKRMPHCAEEWLARHRSGDMTGIEASAFERWLKDDPDNLQSWNELNTIWEGIEPLRSEPGIMVMREAALARGLWRARLTAAPPIAALCGVFLLFAVLLVQHRDSIGIFPQASSEQTATTATFSTPVRKMSHILLSDSSSIQLDADSALTVRYSKNARVIELSRGRALFRVTANPNRPFIVIAAGRTVTAIGTTFSVDLRKSGIQVGLAEGRVRATNQRSDQAGRKAALRAVDMSSGEVLFADDDDSWTVAKRSPSELLAWTAGRLLFSDERISDIVAEVNRYSTTRIVISDASVGDRRLSAVLRAGDIQTLLDGVEGLELAHVVKRTPDLIELSGRQPVGK